MPLPISRQVREELEVAVVDLVEVLADAVVLTDAVALADAVEEDAAELEEAGEATSFRS